jgi:hypothetical protein
VLVQEIDIHLAGNQTLAGEFSQGSAPLRAPGAR